MPCTNASIPNPLLALFIRQSGGRKTIKDRAQQMRFYNGKATVIGDAATFAKFIHNGKYKVPDLPSNNGKFFYGYDKRTMCDEELQLLVEWGKGAGTNDTRTPLAQSIRFLTMALPKC